MDSTELLSVALDPSMTPDAVRVALYYAGLGPGCHAYDRDRLSELLEEAGERRIRKALQRAERQGHLKRHHGGRHTDSFEFSPAPRAAESLSPAPSAGETDVQPAQRAGDSGASSTVTDTSSSPTAGARVDDIHLEKLRRYLGAHAEVLDRFATSAKHAPTWARDIWCIYRPPSGEGRDGGGTEWAATFAEEDEETAVRVLVLALTDYAEKGERYSGMHFRRYVATAKREVRKVDATKLEATGSDNARPWTRPEKPPQDAQVYKPKPYRGLKR